DEVIFCIKNYGKFRSSIFVKLSESNINDILKMCDTGSRSNDISDKFGIDRHCIGGVLKRYGRKSIYSSKKFDHVRKIPVNKHQKEMSIGTLLGDECVHKQRKKSNNMYKYYLRQTKNQKEYFMWKFNNLKPFFTKYYEIET